MGFTTVDNLEKMDKNDFLISKIYNLNNLHVVQQDSRLLNAV